MSPPEGHRDEQASGVFLDAEILSRVLGLDRGECPPVIAKWILSWGLPAADEERMSALAERVRHGNATPVNLLEYEAYLRVGHVLKLMKSRARTSLKSADAAENEFRQTVEYVLEKNRELYRRLASSD